jgi:putative transposase
MTLWPRSRPSSLTCPTYGYRRVHAILHRKALVESRPPPNHKRVYRVMKEHGLLLQHHAGGVERRHDGRIAVASLICAGARMLSRSVARTASGSGLPSRSTAAEHRFGRINRLPRTIERLTDNGSGYITTETRRFAREIGLEPRTTPLESPPKQWHGRGIRANDQARLCPRLPLYFPDTHTMR